jgi:hypothetical protein
MTYTYVKLEVPHEQFDYVADKMRAAGYGHAFHDDGATIDMHGIALSRGEPTAFKVGPKTMQKIFRDNGIENLHDKNMQAVLDAVEASLPDNVDNDGDLAVAIGEDAFNAGWRGGIAFLIGECDTTAFTPKEAASARLRAWSEYDPPEELKGRSFSN